MNDDRTDDKANDHFCNKDDNSEEDGDEVSAAHFPVTNPYANPDVMSSTTTIATIPMRRM